MNVSSKSINANDLDAVYDYFDGVVNQLIRTEVDTDSFPVLTGFVEDLGNLIDKLDELVDDVNPRVEAYLQNKENEEKLKNQMEEMRQQLEELQKERREKFGADGGASSDAGHDIYDDWSGANKGSAVIESPGFIDFNTDIEDMIGDMSTDISFSDEEEEEKKRQEEEELKRQEDEAAEALLEEALNTLNPTDAFAGGLEMQRLGDHYEDLEPEDDLYDDYNRDDDDDDDDDDDMFAGTYGQNYSDFRYEDDEEDDFPTQQGMGQGARDDGWNDNGPAFQDGFDDGYDDGDGYGYGNGFDDGYDDGPQGRRQDDYDDEEDDDWDEDDPFQGRNIDQLLSSASMTI